MHFLGVDCLAARRDRQSAGLLLGYRELCLRGKFEKIISTASWERGIMNEVSLG